MDDGDLFVVDDGLLFRFMSKTFRSESSTYEPTIPTLSDWVSGMTGETGDAGYILVSSKMSILFPV